MNDLHGFLLLISDTICPSYRKLALLSVIHAGGVFLGMGTGYGNPPTPRRGLQGDTSLKLRLGPHHLAVS